ncbi:MAG: coproporphyrinogen III oxidase family protein [Cryomorphaceae bacterium]|nr:MAG: coproporphyrinogen III oxidase family protein [Cryomorphaceae bacterium]
MLGIYIHIPFCKKSCHYCNFHFSTSLKNKEDMIKAINKEIYQKAILNNDKVSTIYFGGGTPSILDVEEINLIIENIYKNFNVGKNIEITIEANPDDLSKHKLNDLSKTKINRISIGVQSFIDKELKIMNRVHDSKKAIKSIEMAKKYFNNISVDLLYGVPDSSIKSWNYNIDTISSFNINHISAYALTVEPKTALESFINKSILSMPDEELVYSQYKLINEKLSSKNFINYEVCSFAQKDFFSKNNSAYWLRKKYIGIGPSAHSFDGESRSWNISNNKKYIDQIIDGDNYYKKENLTKVDQYNEYIMTGLRTIWGVSVKHIESNFDVRFKNYFLKKIKSHIAKKNVYKEDDLYLTTQSGRFLADGIASDLFLVNLKK